MPAEPLSPQPGRDQAAPPPAPEPPPSRPSAVRFTDLAGSAAEVEIEHAGQLYRLRRTRAGKLLLTK